MKENRTPNYGLDAPVAVRNMLIVAALGIISLITRLLGLFLVGAAKRLSTGRAVGIDKWQQEDLSGNNAAGTLSNATIEGVADKVEVHTGDARNLPFPDSTVDVVLSSMALHNIYNAGERQTALREIG